MQSVCFLKSNSLSSMFHRTLFDTPFASLFSTSFLTLALGSFTSPSLSHVHSLPSAKWVMLWPAEQSPLALQEQDGFHVELGVRRDQAFSGGEGSFPHMTESMDTWRRLYWQRHKT